MYFYKTGKKTLRFPLDDWVMKLDEDDGSRAIS